MAKPKNINLFLLDGTADGRIKCTISNGVEIIFKIPRKDLAKCNDRDELKHGGIYFLLGERDELKLTCIGQAGKNLFEQLNEHDREADKNFWTEAIVFTTTNNSFGATELLWLENKFCDLAKNVERLVVKKGSFATPVNVTEEEVSDFESHADFARLVLRAIGYKIFEPLPTVEPTKIEPLPTVEPSPAVAPDEESDEQIFYLSRRITKLGRTIHAQMKITPTGFKVLAGSEISPDENPTMYAVVKKARRSAKIDANGILLEDMECKTSTMAGMFVMGNKVAGPTEWQTRDGEPLKNFL